MRFSVDDALLCGLFVAVIEEIQSNKLHIYFAWTAYEELITLSNDVTVTIYVNIN